jgi:uncharacterized protein (DUF1778 family)
MTFAPMDGKPRWERKRRQQLLEQRAFTADVAKSRAIRATGEQMLSFIEALHAPIPKPERLRALLNHKAPWEHVGGEV